jgi:hypothetical protein
MNDKPQKYQIMKPNFRWSTTKAEEELAKELNLPYKIGMQDWTYEVANYTDIDKYINHYKKLKNEDKKFALMQTIIQATEDQITEETFVKHCNIIKPIITKDFSNHEYTVYYWSCFDNKNIADCWQITPFMRQLWEENGENKTEKQ